MSEAGVVVALVAWAFVGVIPWTVLFLVAFKRSLCPCRWSDEVYGEDEGNVAFKGKLKYFVIIGAMTVYMNAVLWISLIPGQLFRWESFPPVCIVPRSGWGVLALHSACWHHFSFLHFANNNFCTWTLGPLLLSYNRRTFVSATFFTGLVGDAFVWIAAPSNTCHAGFSVVLFGWFAVLTVAFFLECPPKWWRLLLLIVVAGFLGASFYEEVIKGDITPGISWHGHAGGFGAGLLYGFLRFGRGWYECEGLEDRVRPRGSGATCRQVLVNLCKEAGAGLWESAADLLACFTCRGPKPKGWAQHSDSPPVGPATVGARQGSL